MYLLNGIRFGFDTLVSILDLPTFECKNLLSAIRDPESVDMLLKQEIDKGYVKGPFSSPPFETYRVSPIGICKKAIFTTTSFILDHLLTRTNLPKSSTSSRDSTHSVSEILASNVELNAKVKNLIHNSIASSTRSQYEHGFKSYKNFLCLSGFKWDDKTDMPPLTEDILMHYATHCHENLKIKCSTIKMYICGLRYIYLQSGVQCLFTDCCSSKLLRLETIYRGIKKQEVKSSRKRLPLTYDIIKNMITALHKGIFSPFVTALIEAACVVAYFGFLRCGELTVNTDFDASCNLCIEDITLKRVACISCIRVWQTARSGVNVYLSYHFCADRR
ncbi:unnamed protein product [Mytilus edulis]|uniref:Core-binding (CB) domain-containing protein n=1 Tax=Mytilus edulis TaxID=6550 RepID=A0A8S3VBH4_MYTED|nr:unnamed protein product [Mytilus edulis]